MENLRGFARKVWVTYKFILGISDDYLGTQQLRQKLLDALLVHLDTLKVLQLSDPKDGNVKLFISYIAPSLRDFSINAINISQ